MSFYIDSNPDWQRWMSTQEIISECAHIVRIVNTCTACPSQWDMWDSDGVYYYVRYRHGNFRVERDGHIILQCHSDNAWGGDMSTEEMQQLTKHLFLFNETE